MKPIIDLSSEVLIDRSRIRNPHLRLILTALGQELAMGSPWVAISKKVAFKEAILLLLIDGHTSHAAL